MSVKGAGGSPIEPTGLPSDQSSKTGQVKAESGGHTFSVQSGKPHSILNNQTADNLNRLQKEMKTHKFTVTNPFTSISNAAKKLWNSIFSKGEKTVSKPEVESRQRSNAQIDTKPEARVRAQALDTFKAQAPSRETQANDIRKQIDETIKQTKIGLLKDSTKLDPEQLKDNERELDKAGDEAKNALYAWRNQTSGPNFDLDKAMAKFKEAARNWEADNLLANNQ